MPPLVKTRLRRRESVRAGLIGNAATLSPTAALADNAASMTYLRAFGPKGDQVALLTWGLLIVAILVTVLIGALTFICAILRRAAGNAAVSVGAVYRHFVDGVRLILFFTFYITPRLG